MLRQGQEQIGWFRGRKRVLEDVVYLWNQTDFWTYQFHGPRNTFSVQFELDFPLLRTKIILIQEQCKFKKCDCWKRLWWMYQWEIKGDGLQSRNVSLLEEIIRKAKLIYGIYWFSISFSVCTHLLKEKLDVVVKNPVYRFR